MPENINTTPLGDIERELAAAVDDRPVMVDVDRVSMVFNMASQQLNSLKEYAIALAKRELMFKEFRALKHISFKVRRGDVVGEIPEKALGARIHASIDGVVSAVDARGVEITGGESA